jgi:hypothetical protein
LVISADKGNYNSLRKEGIQAVKHKEAEGVPSFNRTLVHLILDSILFFHISFFYNITV